MIKATFYYRAKVPVGFQVTGHSGTEESGKDIVCAGVTSAVMFAVNMITETFGAKATVTVGKNSVFVEKCENPDGQKVIGALKDHLAVIQTDYPYALNIRIITETEE